jgi:hypothetical protein
MSPVQLESPVLAGGIRSLNYFNGRLLSAEDLTREQAALYEQRRRIGVALGEGIVGGLEVAEAQGVSTVGQPVVTVRSGLAVNRNGHVVTLPTNVDVALAVPPTEGTATARTAFAPCEPLETGVYVAGTGVFLLVVRPAEGAEGRAPVSGLGNEGAACNVRYTVEGAAFRLIRLPMDPAELRDDSRLRSRVAYRCFGLDDPLRRALARNPFGPPATRYGLLDALRPNQLTDCDVPLAAIHWVDGQGIRFVDLWSVRRRLTLAGLDGRWGVRLGDRRRSEAEAMFFQFQEHVEALSASLVTGRDVVASDHFHFLPPVGVLPQAELDAPRGFAHATFFSGRRYREPAFVEGARLEGLLRASLDYPPIEADRDEAIWLYWVRENQHPRLREAAPWPPSYLIFSSGQLPLQTESRADVARANYGYYA